MKPLATIPDAERVVIDYLTAALLAQGEDVTCGVNVPATWTTGTKSHVQVGLDGTPTTRYPFYASAAIRVTVWNASTTAAKALAALCEGLLLSHPGGGSVAGIKSGTGVLPTKDPDTTAQLATIGVSVRLRFAVVA